MKHVGRYINLIAKIHTLRDYGGLHNPYTWRINPMTDVSGEKSHD